MIVDSIKTTYYLKSLNLPSYPVFSMEMLNTIKQRIHASLWRHTSVVASMTMLSRILGFARDMVTAYLFGAAVGMDAFIVAFKIPNFMRRLFAEGAFSQAFVPILSEYQHHKSQEEVKQFVSTVTGMLGVIVFVVTILSIIFAPVLIRIFAPGFEPGSERSIWAAEMLRITFPYLFLISLAALGGAVLNTYGAFAIPAFTPLLLNVAMIVTAFFLAPILHPSVASLAWGVFIGGILQLVYQFPKLKSLDLLPMPRFHRHDPGVKRVLKQMVPALFGVSVSQINLMFDTLFSSFLPIGSVSWLYYSDRVTSLPLGVFGVALSTVILPHLSRKHAANSKQDFSRTTDWALRNILMLSIPSMVAIFILADPLLLTLFKRGNFHLYDVIMTKKSLIAFTIGIPAFMAVKVLATVFYSTQNIRTPVRIAIISMITNIFLNLILIHYLAHAGLALATSLAAFLNAGLLWFKLRQLGIFELQPGWRWFLFRLSVSTGIMAAILYFPVPKLAVWLDWGWQWRFANLFMWVLIGLMTYVVTLYLCRPRLKQS